MISSSASPSRLLRGMVALVGAALASTLSLAPASAATGGTAGDSPGDAPTGGATSTVPGAVPVESDTGIMSHGTCPTVSYLDSSGNRVLRVDEGCDLDQYLFADSSPLEFAINLDTYGGPVFGDGSPAPGNEFFDRDARITLRAFDVDDDYPGSDVAREMDQLLVNGHTLEIDGGGLLSGADNQWSVVTFRVHTSLLRFPSADGEVVTNDFEILIDIGNGGQLVWAVEIDWAELRLSDDLLPAALLHGITSDGGAMQDIKDYYELVVPELQGVLINPSMTRNGSIAENVSLVEGPIEDLLQATGASQLNLVAHSMGGLASRLYAWDNPGRVRTVMMIGTPNGGSRLADILCGNRNIPWWAGGLGSPSLDWLTGEFGECDGPGDGLYQLQQSYVQDVFNRQVLDRYSTTYFTIAGQGNHPANILLDGEDDGAVTVASVRYLRPDLPEDPNPDNPGLHRALYPAYELSHSDLIKEDDDGQSEAIQRSLCTAYAREYRCPSNIWSAPSGVTAGTMSQTSVELAANGSLVVPAGGGASLALDVESSPAAMVLVFTGDTAVTGTWDGAPMQQTDVFGVPALVVNDAGGGSGTLQLDNSGADDAPVVAIVAVETSRVMTVTPPAGLAQAGSPITATLTLTDSSPTEDVHFQVTDPTGTVVASGLATHVNGEEWSVSFTPATAGSYTVAGWTEGQGARSGHTIVPVAADDGHKIETTGVTDAGVDDNGDGSFEALAVNVPITSPSGGSYRLAARLRSTGGTVVAATGTVATLPAGTSPVNLRFDGQQIFGSGHDGPYTVTDVVLSDVDDLTILDEVDVLATTAAFQAGDFDHHPVKIDEYSFTDTAEDLTGDGTFDLLRVTGQVHVDLAGTYAINARLLTADGVELVETQQTTTLDAGANGFALEFDWEGIRAGGIDGPYAVADLSIYPTFDADGLGYLITAHTTEAYPASGATGGGTVTGTVWCDGSPAGFSSVTLDGEVYWTDGYATFEFVEVPSGEQQLRADPFFGSVCRTVEITVTVNSGGTTQVDVHLPLYPWRSYE
jgi:pimeloyl-ACP methyl ester carboxylesterase